MRWYHTKDNTMSAKSSTNETPPLFHSTCTGVILNLQFFLHHRLSSYIGKGGRMFLRKRCANCFAQDNHHHFVPRHKSPPPPYPPSPPLPHRLPTPPSRTDYRLTLGDLFVLSNSENLYSQAMNQAVQLFKISLLKMNLNTFDCSDPRTNDAKKTAVSQAKG